MTDYRVETYEGGHVNVALETDDLAEAVKRFGQLCESVPSAVGVRLVSPGAHE